MHTTVTVLGAGAAGLAAGFFLRQRGRPGLVLEAGSRIGGNATTLATGAFRYDSGAHRFHDKHPGATSVVRSLLGDELAAVSAPSRIAYRDGFVGFPLSPLSTVRALGIRESWTAALDLLRARMNGTNVRDDFESFAVSTYGRSLASTFLLGYSEKLWGLPCSHLAKDVSGARLNGLTLGTLVAEACLGHARKSAHLDGTFLYPRGGIGRIGEALADGCGRDGIRLQTRITAVRHDGTRIRELELNGRETLAVGPVISTIPLGTLVKLLDPPAPSSVTQAAAALTFRHVILVALFLAKPSVTPCATVYFPAPDLPFTRVYEPRNRSPLMAPPGHTSLVAEIPCGEGTPLWGLDDGALTEMVRGPLSARGWIREGELIGTAVHRLAHAYPVLSLAARDALPGVRQYLSGFSNLRLTGRVGRFGYTHIHDQIAEARAAVDAAVDA